IIVFLEDGSFMVTRVSDKAFIGKNILHADVWNKNDERMTYNMIYRDGKSGISYAKRFTVTAITRDKQYDLTKGNKGSKTLYFTANPNSESETVTVYLSQSCRARIKVFDFDFAELAIKGRGAQGNIFSKYPIKKILQKSVGASTLGGLDIWYDETIGRLNTDERGLYLGNFEGDDLILAIYKDGTYELTSYELSNHYDLEKTILIEQFDPEKVITVVHFDGDTENFYVKRFKIETLTQDKLFKYITDHRDSRLVIVTTHPNPSAEMRYLKGRAKEEMAENISLNEIVDVKGWKARGNRISSYRVIGIDLIEKDEPEIIIAEESEPEIIIKTGKDEISSGPHEDDEDTTQGDLFNTK
ncbi:MAG: DNA gyrase/topoisomerase IV subunit A, partial [Calditrichaceae bacterium]